MKFGGGGLGPMSVCVLRVCVACVYCVFVYMYVYVFVCLFVCSSVTCE